LSVNGTKSAVFSGASISAALFFFVLRPNKIAPPAIIIYPDDTVLQVWVNPLNFISFFLNQILNGTAKSFATYPKSSTHYISRIHYIFHIITAFANSSTIVKTKVKASVGKHYLIIHHHPFMQPGRQVLAN
jgi:hypothetical protein